jgi:hypothetical protein
VISLNGFKKNKNGTTKRAARIVGINEPIHEDYPLNKNSNKKKTDDDDLLIKKTYI